MITIDLEDMTILSPEAIANAFVYLCSSLANELDGHALQVDNGVGLPKLG